MLREVFWGHQSQFFPGTAGAVFPAGGAREGGKEREKKRGREELRKVQREEEKKGQGSGDRGRKNK